MDRPKDFGEKNALPLKALLFPDSVAEQERFDLTPDDYRFLYHAMSRYPARHANPGMDEYRDADDYPQAFVKYLMYERDDAIPDNIRIFNKIGSAYGFLLSYRRRLYRRLRQGHRVHPCSHRVYECQ